MKHFVTGGAGFIGSTLVDRLVAEENKVTVYDNLVSGKIENIKHHLDKKSIDFIQADLVDTHEQSSWYFITQASLDLNPGALDARRTSVSSPFPPQLWRQNTLATKPHFLSNTAVLTRRTFSLIHYLYAALF